MIPISRYLVFATIALGGCALDLTTKAWIFSWPPGPGRRGEWWLVENYVGVQQAVNQGALFGMGQGFSLVFAGFSVVALTGILIWLFFLRAAQDGLLTVALASISGGILGNLYDRLGLWGGVDAVGRPLRAVRDWILFCYHEHVWPNFNIADCLLVGGAGLLAWHAFRPLPKSDASPESTATSGS